MDFQLKWLVPNFLRSVYRSCVIADLTIWWCFFFFFPLIQSVYGEPLKEDILSRHVSTIIGTNAGLHLFTEKKEIHCKNEEEPS